MPVDIENPRLKLALAIPTGAPITVANDVIQGYHLLQIKQLKISGNNKKKNNIFTKPVIKLINSLSLISPMK